MNRQIEFRGKCIHTNKWIHGFLFIKEPPLVCLAECVREEPRYYIIRTGFADWNMERPTSMFEVDSKTVGQFTGCFDKNNKKIFESDIVKVPFGYGGDYHYNEANGLVIFESREFRIHSENLSDSYSWNDLEVIGNTIDGVKNVDN